MEAWNDRPFEYRRLFNPAFCAVVLMYAIDGYKKVTGKGMPFSLCFLILPLCLYEDSRDIFKARSRSKLLTIIADHPELMIGFPRRARALIPYTLEGLGYAFQSGCFDVSDDGSLQIRGKIIKPNRSGSEEVKACQLVAGIIGTAFAKLGSKITIFTSLGVRP